MKRYDMRVSDIHTGVDAVKMPEGGWVKWEDVGAIIPCPVYGTFTTEQQLEWLWANCKIVYWPDGTPTPYPLEHNAEINKDMRKMIEGCMAIPSAAGTG